jgi:3-phosphoshikimate 1-carboxyvinyltransferase
VPHSGFTIGENLRNRLKLEKSGARPRDAARLATWVGRCQKPRPMRDDGAQPMVFQPRGPLRGTPRVPGDKSISHRALMLAAMAAAEAGSLGLSDGERRRFDRRGAARDGRPDRAGRRRAGQVDGVGVGGLLQPEGALDMGNSGTSARLLMGLVASHPITADLHRRRLALAAGRWSGWRRRSADRRRLSASPGGRLPLTCAALPGRAGTHRLAVAVGTGQIGACCSPASTFRASPA